MAASALQGHRYVELKPVTEGDGWDAEALLKAISPTTLPPGDNEALEKAELKRRGWRDPRGLFGYSKDSPYKDLYIYFDAADRSSPVNVAASKAFRCYGLDGKQGVIDWEVIRGPCVLLRGEPPKMTSFTTGKLEQMDFPYHPLITPQELVHTLRFFQNRDAHKVALKRDATRSMMDIPRNHPMWGSAPPGAAPTPGPGGKGGAAMGAAEMGAAMSAAMRAAMDAAQGGAKGAAQGAAMGAAMRAAMGAAPGVSGGGAGAAPGVSGSGAGVYVSPAGTRPLDKVAGKDARTCGGCGKPNSIACGLKKCSACKSVWYCGLDCQRKDFPSHKKECKALAAAAAAAAAAAETAAAKES